MKDNFVAASKEIIVIFRYDDFSSNSPDVVDNALIHAFAQQGVSCTFGVVPFVTAGDYRDSNPCEEIALTEAKVQILKKAMANSAVDIALHGCNHRTNYKQPPHSEFYGLDYEVQLVKIRRGKEFMEGKFGAPVTTFIPPWNSYDRNTLKALDKAGIDCISANRYGLAEKPLQLKYAPIVAETSDLKRAINSARKMNEAPLIVVLIHPYDFTESGDSRAKISCIEFGNLLLWLSSQQDIKICSISQLLSQRVSLGGDRFIANRPSLLENILPPFIAKTNDTPFYMSVKNANKMKTIKILNAAIFFILIGVTATILGYWGSRIVFNYSEILSSVMSYATVAALIAHSVRIYRKRALYFKGALLFVTLLGFLLGYLLNLSFS